MPRIKNLTGQRFGRLIVLKDSGIRVGKGFIPKWLCQCDCGKLHIASRQGLQTGNITSCGCFQKEQIQKSITTRFGSFENRGLRDRFRRYKGSAKHRVIEWSLSFEEFCSLIKGKCIFCGQENTTHSKTGHGRKFEFNYTGIDRLDYTKGYTLKNCRTCCSICNYMKGKLSTQEFCLQVEKIHKQLSV